MTEPYNIQAEADRIASEALPDFDPKAMRRLEDAVWSDAAEVNHIDGASMYLRVQISPNFTQTIPVMGYYLYGEQPQPPTIPVPRLSWWRRLAIHLLGGQP